MITTIAPLVLDSTASGAASQVTYVAAPIWDIGANIKNQGITFAVYLLLGGSALVSAGLYFIGQKQDSRVEDSRRRRGPSRTDRFAARTRGDVQGHHRRADQQRRTR